MRLVEVKLVHTLRNVPVDFETIRSRSQTLRLLNVFCKILEKIWPTLLSVWSIYKSINSRAELYLEHWLRATKLVSGCGDAVGTYSLIGMLIHIEIIIFGSWLVLFSNWSRAQDRDRRVWERDNAIVTCGEKWAQLESENRVHKGIRFGLDLKLSSSM